MIGRVRPTTYKFGPAIFEICFLSKTTPIATELTNKLLGLIVAPARINIFILFL